MTDTPPAAPSDREAALLAENEMLREAAGAYFIRSLVGGRLPADVAAGRQARRALADILATPPGAAGQAVLDAADALSEAADRELADYVFYLDDETGPWGAMRLGNGEEINCGDTPALLRDAAWLYRQARAGSSSGQPRGEGGE